MRRLPIYFLVDVSESMAGTPIEEVERGMRTIIQELRVDPYALETAFVSIIAFAGRPATLSPLTELYKFYPPIFPIGGGTFLGAALDYLMDELDQSIQKTTLEVKGDWKPIIFLFTDGNPTDRCQKAFRRWNERYRSHCNLVAISLGDDVDTLTLAQLTENVLVLKETDAESFRKFFKWVTASIKNTSESVNEQGNSELKLAPTSGINLEKAIVEVPGGAILPQKVDENFVVLHGRCSNTQQDYLVKYGKRTPGEEPPGPELYARRIYRLLGAYPIDREKYAAMSTEGKASVNTETLRGVPTCPCCGNQLGVVVCECGNIFCVGDGAGTRCPWCGMQGELGNIASGGIDITRTIG